LYPERNQKVCIQEETRWAVSKNKTRWFDGLYPGGTRWLVPGKKQETRWFVSNKKPHALYPRTRPDGLMVCIQEETRWLVSKKKPDGLYPGRNQMRCIQEQDQMV